MLTALPPRFITALVTVLVLLKKSESVSKQQ